MLVAARYLLQACAAITLSPLSPGCARRFPFRIRPIMARAASVHVQSVRLRLRAARGEADPGQAFLWLSRTDGTKGAGSQASKRPLYAEVAARSAGDRRR